MSRTRVSADAEGAGQTRGVVVEVSSSCGRRGARGGVRGRVHAGWNGMGNNSINKMLKAVNVCWLVEV